MHKPNLTSSFLVFSLFLATSAYADPLSYTGRLTNSNGSPVTGPVDLKIELAYTDPGTGFGNAVCTKTINNVPLTNGVFHLKLDFTSGECGGSSITNILANTPAGESAALRVTDLTHAKDYSYHALYSLPYAQIANLAKTLPKMGANNGQALTWNGSTWAPANVGQGDGTVTQINTGAGLVGGPITTTGTISIADGGVTSAKLDSMGAVIGQVLKWSGIAWVPSSDSGVMSETDPTVATFAKTAPQDCPAGQTLQARVPFPGLICEALVVSSDNVTEGPTNLFFTDTRAKTAAVADSITDAVTDVAPSQNAVFDALALKQNTLTAADDLLVRSIMFKTSGSANAVGFIAPTTATSSVQWTLPNVDGAAGYVLKTDGAGKLGWVSPSSGSVVNVTGLAPIATSGSSTTTVSLNYDNSTIGLNGSSDLSVLPAGITNTQISNSAGIAWTKISKAGAVAADVAAADVTRQIIAGTGLVGGGDLSSDRTLNVDVGTVANKIVQLNGSAQLPAVDGRLLTNIDPLNFSGVVPVSMGGTGQSSTTSNSMVTISGAGAYQYSTCGAGQVLSFTGSGFACITPSIAGSSFVQNGNSFGASAVLGTNDNFKLSFETNDVNRLTLDTAGRVGIGTSTPNAKLDVNGGLESESIQLQFPTDHTPGNPVGVLAFNWYSENWKIKAHRSSSNPIDALSFAINDNEKMRITPSGNVGIGTTTPGYPLSVVGTGSFAPNSATAHNIGVYANPQTATTGVNVGFWSNTLNSSGNRVVHLLTGNITPPLGGFGIYQGDGNSNYFSGNVGIGITSPAQSLDVSNTMRITSTGASGIEFYDSTAAALGPAVIAKIAGNNMVNHGSGSIAFSTAINNVLTEQMVIDRSGNVGIGTTAPAATAILDLTSSMKGFLLPRMTTAQRDGISSPALGLQIYNTSTNAINYYDGSWKAIGAVGSSITSISAGTGLTGGTITTTGTIAVDVGTGPGQIVQLDALSRLPSVDGSQLTGLNPANLSTVVPIAKGGTGLAAAGAVNTLLGVNGAGNALEYKALSANSPLVLTHGVGTMALDLGTVPTSKGGTGLTSTSAHRIITTDASGAFQQSMCSVGEVLSFSGVGFSCILPTTTSNGFMQNGNSFGTTATLGTNDSFALNFETNNINRMAIDTNGNVGIGTNSPATPLEVAGNFRTSATNPFIEMNATYAAIPNLAKLGVRSAGEVVLDSNKNNTALANWQMKIGVGTGVNPNDAFYIGREASPGAGLSIPFYVSNAGNVGIGTTNPTSKLQVLGDGTFSSGSGNLTITPDYSGRGVIQSYQSAGVFRPLQIDGLGMTISGKGQPIALMDSSVGIGTSAPDAQLHLKDGTGLHIQSTDARIRMSGTASSMGLHLDNSSDLHVKNQADAPVVTFKQGGNVGIGTTTPRAKLDVAGGDAFFDVNRGLVWSANSDGAFVTFRSVGNAFNESYLELGTTDDGDEPILFTISGVERMRVAHTGVQIPNALTANSVTTNSLSTTSFATSSLSTNTMTTGSIIFNPPPGDGSPVITSRQVPSGQGAANEKTELILFHNNDYNNGSGVDQITLRAPALSFQTYAVATVYDINDPAGYNERMYIDPYGSVGIGTTSPSEKLDVIGNVRASSFISTSDRRLKTNFKKTSGNEILKSLTGYRFDWKDNGITEYGVIAQDVEKVMPEAVVTNQKTGYKSVKYNSLFAPVIEAIKELYSEVTGQKKEIIELKMKNKELEDRLARLERTIASEKPQVKPQVKPQKK